MSRIVKNGFPAYVVFISNRYINSKQLTRALKFDRPYSSSSVMNAPDKSNIALLVRRLVYEDNVGCARFFKYERVWRERVKHF